MPAFFRVAPCGKVVMQELLLRAEFQHLCSFTAVAVNGDSLQTKLPGVLINPRHSLECGFGR